MKGKQGGYFINLMVGLLFVFMIIAVLVALIPGMTEMIGLSQDSTALNCPGYAYNGDADHYLSYNSSKQSNTTACLGIKLIVPFLILCVLGGVVTRLLAGESEVQTPYGY